MALGVGDFVRTSVNFLLGSGDLYQNVYTHVFDGIGGISDEAVVLDIKAWAESMYGQIVTVVAADVVEQLSYVDQVAWVLDAWEVVDNIGTFTPTFAPSAAGVILPNQSSAFIVFKTARPKTVGRKFLFPVGASTQTQGIMDGGTVTLLVQFADLAVNDIVLDVANGLVPGVVRTGVDEWWPFQVAVVTNLLGTQRRRRPGYGA